MDHTRARLSGILANAQPFGGGVLSDRANCAFPLGNSPTSVEGLWTRDTRDTRKGGDYEESMALHRLLASHTTTAAMVRQWLMMRSSSDDKHDDKDHDLDDDYQLRLQRRAQLVSHPNKDGVTALHVAVVRNSYHVADICQTLLSTYEHGAQLSSRQPHVNGSKRSPTVRLSSLATARMSCGTTPLHAVCSQSLTLNAPCVERLLAAAPQVATWQDCHGDTPLSLLYKNVLRFRWALQWECGGPATELPPAMVHQLLIPHTTIACLPREHVTLSSLGNPLDHLNCNRNNNGIPRNNSSHDLSCMTIVAPHQFLRHALQLVEAAAPTGSTNMSHRQAMDTGDVSLSWHVICSTPRCPPLLVRMLLHYYTTATTTVCPSSQPEQQHISNDAAMHCDPLSDNNNNKSFLSSYQLVTPDAQGRLPLHWAAATPAVSPKFVPTTVVTTVVELLLLHTSSARLAATAVDDSHRLPLHYAVTNPTLTARAVWALARAHPLGLTVPDPTTGLSPALGYAATVETTTAEAASTTFYTAPPTSRRSTTEYNDSLHATRNTADDESNPTLSSLDVLYLLVRAHPSVCESHWADATILNDDMSVSSSSSSPWGHGSDDHDMVVS